MRNIPTFFWIIYVFITTRQNEQSLNVWKSKQRKNYIIGSEEMSTR